jgi:Xaa-Pro aminopeptidase
VVSLGTLALDDGTRFDASRLRRERRQRVLDAMEESDIDVLVVGREPNARYISGARRLFVAGTRPFGPGCVLVRASGDVHLMSTWDDGVPEEIPHDHLYGMSWNPMNLVAAIGKIEGVNGARRIGVDSMTPLFAQLFPIAAPDAQLVDAESLLRRVRARKTADEIFCIRTAVAVAEAAVTTAADSLRPGIRERELLGIFDARMTEFGVAIPAFEGTFCATEPTAPGETPRLRRLVSDNAIEAGALVAVAGGVLYAGYEGALGRTYPCVSRRDRRTRAESRDLYRRWEAVWDRLAEACQPGNTGADLRAAYAASGEPIPDFPIAYGVGLGQEGPIAGSALGPDFDGQRRLDAGMVLGVQAYVAGATGGYFGLETVLITDDGHEVLSTLAHGPLSQDR